MIKGTETDKIKKYSSDIIAVCGEGIKKTRHQDAFKEQKVHEIAGIARVTSS